MTGSRLVQLMLVASLTLGLSLATAVLAAGQSASVLPAQEVGGGRVLEQFGVLQRPRNAMDAMPARLQTAVVAMNAQPAGVDPALFEGLQLPAQSRLLLADAGSLGIDIYGYPTSKGRVCFLMSSGAGGCVSRDHPVGWIETAPGASELREGVLIRIAGIVPNNVRSVYVSLAGALEAARHDNNAFYWETRWSGTAPAELVLTYTNGAKASIDLPTIDQLG